MNPFLAAIIGTLLGLKRTCPGCGRVQTVPMRQKRQKVRCKFCGAQIPPGK